MTEALMRADTEILSVFATVRESPSPALTPHLVLAELGWNLSPDTFDEYIQRLVRLGFIVSAGVKGHKLKIGSPGFFVLTSAGLEALSSNAGIEKFEFGAVIDSPLADISSIDWQKWGSIAGWVAAAISAVAIVISIWLDYN